MHARLDFAKANPAAFKAMLALEQSVRGLGIAPTTLHLVKLRASQLNGCARCIAMHTKEARADGEDQRRLDMLQVWDETELFDPREQAALLWTETLTDLRDHAPDAAYARVAAVLDPAELVALTVAINAINGWNRLCVGFRTTPEI